jgi:hypothetical protein
VWETRTRSAHLAQTPRKRRALRRLLGTLLLPVVVPVRLTTGAVRAVAGAIAPSKARRVRMRAAGEADTAASPPPHTPLPRSSSARSLGGGGDTPLGGGGGAHRSSQHADAPALPQRRDVLGEKVTPATRLALEAAGLEDSAAPERRASGAAAGAASRASRAEHAHDGALDAIAAALKAAGAPPKLATDRALLARFASTRAFEVSPTVDILLQYARWRADLQLDAMSRASVATELDKRYVMWLPASCDDGTAPPCAPGVPLGRDAEGHPVLYKCMASWERHPRGDARAVEAAHAWAFDAVCRAMDADVAGGAREEDTFTVLLDLTSTASRFDVDAFRALGAMLKLGFRGRLHRMIIYPAGRLERMVFAGLKKFLGKGTPQKVRMLAAEDRAALLAAFPQEVLPAHLGGRSMVVAGARRNMRRSLSSASVGSASAATLSSMSEHTSTTDLAAAVAEGGLQQQHAAADAAGDGEGEEADGEGAGPVTPRWPLGWMPRESAQERLLKLAVRAAEAAVFAECVARCCAGVCATLCADAFLFVRPACAATAFCAAHERRRATSRAFTTPPPSRSSSPWRHRRRMPGTTRQGSWRRRPVAAAAALPVSAASTACCSQARWAARGARCWARCASWARPGACCPSCCTASPAAPSAPRSSERRASQGAPPRVCACLRLLARVFLFLFSPTTVAARDLTAVVRVCSYRALHQQCDALRRVLHGPIVSARGAHRRPQGTPRRAAAAAGASGSWLPAALAARADGWQRARAAAAACCARGNARRQPCGRSGVM